eukprot:7384901-Prymnesium_polylepis.4
MGVGEQREVAVSAAVGIEPEGLVRRDVVVAMHVYDVDVRRQGDRALRYLGAGVVRCRGVWFLYGGEQGAKHTCSLCPVLLRGENLHIQRPVDDPCPPAARSMPLGHLRDEPASAWGRALVVTTDAGGDKTVRHAGGDTENATQGAHRSALSRSALVMPLAVHAPGRAAKYSRGKLRTLRLVEVAAMVARVENACFHTQVARSEETGGTRERLHPRTHTRKKVAAGVSIPGEKNAAPRDRPRAIRIRARHTRVAAQKKKKKNS